MNNYVTALTIKTLRTKIGYTQKELGDKLLVSDKAISKWETGRGLPDITILPSLASALGVSVAELMSGDYVTNLNKSANIKKCCFYVCPVCSNVIFATGNAAISCCGISLPPLEVEEPDNIHIATKEIIENEEYITINHPMTKEHYISFIAKITTDEVTIKKLYPEQNAQGYFRRCGKGDYYIYCNKHGLFKV